MLYKGRFIYALKNSTWISYSSISTSNKILPIMFNSAVSAMRWNVNNYCLFSTLDLPTGVLTGIRGGTYGRNGTAYFIDGYQRPAFY